jgi:hypothetical protein
MSRVGTVWWGERGSYDIYALYVQEVLMGLRLMCIRVHKEGLI